MKPTIRSIAKMCGVSRGTVDRVLNNRPYVSPAVRERVLRAVQESGYVHPLEAASKSPAAHIGFLVTQWESEYFRQQTEHGIRRARRHLRPGELTMTIETMLSRADTEYLRRIEHMLSAGVRGIILNAANNILLRAAIDDLASRGIPVITYNSDLPASRRVCHVGQDLVKSAQVAAGLLARSIGPQDTVFTVTGNLEFASNSVRVDAFYAHMKKLGITSDRLTLAECFERYDLTYEAVQGALRADPRLRGIYMGTEDVPACLDAIKKAKLPHPVHVVVNDLTPHAVQGLKSGMIDFVVEQDFAAQAYEAILAMYALLAHDRKPKSPVQNVETSIYTKELL